MQLQGTTAEWFLTALLGRQSPQVSSTTGFTHGDIQLRYPQHCLGEKGNSLGQQQPLLGKGNQLCRRHASTERGQQIWARPIKPTVR